MPHWSMLGPLLFTLYTADMGKLIQQYSFSHHSYADDNQLYASCIPFESEAVKAKIIRFMVSVDEWIASNRLMLNSSKSEFMWSAFPRHIHLINRSPFDLPDGPVSISTMVRNLRAYFDECMSMEEYVNRLVRSCFYQLRRIRFIRCSLSIAVATSLTNSFIIATVDYCNSILAGLTKHQTGQSSTLQHSLSMTKHVLTTSRQLWGTDSIGWEYCKGLNSSSACSCTRQFMGWHQLTSPTIALKFQQDDASVHPCTGVSTFPLLPRRWCSLKVHSRSAGWAYGTIFQILLRRQIPWSCSSRD